MDQKSGKPSQKRRAILQGSLAAPLVLTVSSASAQMVTSHMKCIAKVRQPNLSQEPGLFAVKQNVAESIADTWLRTEIDVKLFQKETSPAEWFYFDGFHQEYVRTTDLMKLSALEGWLEVPNTATEKRWALVWVDSRDGKPINVITVQPPSYGQFTTESCNTSVNPGANPG